jgi:hypothetical protein
MRAVILLVAGVLAIPQVAAGGVHYVGPVEIDLAPEVGIAPDGNSDFMVWGELLEVEYDGVIAGTVLTTEFVGGGLTEVYEVTVTNLMQSWAENVVLTIEKPVFFGDPTHTYFELDTIVNPPGLAFSEPFTSLEAAAYPLGNLPPGGSASAQVRLQNVACCFDGAFDAESIGFFSRHAVPGWSDASVLLIAEPATLFLIGLAVIALSERRRL